MKKLILVLLIAFVAPYLTIAQTTPQTSCPNQSFVIPPAKDPVLYDQMINFGGNGIPVQVFEASFSCYDCEGADDFTVPAGFLWNVTGVTVYGVDYYDAFPANVPVNVVFYNDNLGQPGTVHTQFIGFSVPTTDLLGGLISLPAAVLLPEGKYWISVRVDIDFSLYGQFFWMESSVLHGSIAMWRNPGNCFNAGAIDWTLKTTLSIGEPSNPDLMFRLFGFEESANLNVVPISNWALFLGIAMIVAFTAFRFFKIK